MLDMRPAGSAQAIGLKELINDIEGSNLVMAELGSYRGEGTRIFAESGKFKTIYCIDPFEGLYDSDDPASELDDFDNVEEDFDLVQSNFPCIVKLKYHSSTAPLLQQKTELDLVYIDACHAHYYVLCDIKLYSPLVKVGGYISGHDYGYDKHPGVERAVNSQFSKDRIKKYRDFSWMVKNV